MLLSSLGLLYEEKSGSLESTPLLHGIVCFEGPGTQVGATWAEKSSPIGPEWPRSGKSERSGQSSWPCRFGLAVNVMERTATQPKIKSSRSSKSI